MKTSIFDPEKDGGIIVKRSGVLGHLGNFLASLVGAVILGLLCLFVGKVPHRGPATSLVLVTILAFCIGLLKLRWWDGICFFVCIVVGFYFGLKGQFSLLQINMLTGFTIFLYCLFLTGGYRCAK